MAGNIQLVTEKEAVDLVRRPGQRQILVVMGDVIEPFPVRAGLIVPHLLQPREHLAVDPETQGGVTVITGTRVPYDGLGPGALISAMPKVMESLDAASGQRLVRIVHSIRPLPGASESLTRGEIRLHRTGRGSRAVAQWLSLFTPRPGGC